MEVTIEQAVKALKEGKTILYPTDTVWGLGCDATNSEAVKKIYEIKQRSESKALIVLLPNLNVVANHVQDISSSVVEILEKAERPTTIIYPKAKNLAKNLIAENGSIAIRMPNHDFCQQLLKAFGKPIVSTSANISGEPTPAFFEEISENVVEQVDFVVDSKLFAKKTTEKPLPSNILLIKENDEILKLR